MDLRARLADRREPVFLYGTTPPRSGATAAQVNEAAEKLAARVRPLALDGLVVYDIQDESGRTSQPRPFPFIGTVDPRRYATLLRERTGLTPITYKALGGMAEAPWQAWLVESAQADLRVVSVVGRPTSGVRYPLALARAVRLAAEHPARFTVGGVAIAERHTEERSEAARLLAKAVEGCAYFISQTVYHAASPLAKSIEICRDNLRRILDQPYAADIPLGVNVESVSINRDEIDASIDLCHALREVMSAR